MDFLIAIAAWFLVSIPVALVVGKAAHWATGGQ